MSPQQNAALTVVLVLDHAYVSGGQSRVAFDSALGLKRAGHRPIVFTAVGPVDPALTAAGVEVICLGQDDLVGNPSRLKAAVQGIWNWPAVDALGRLLATLPAESSVVHVHGWAKALSPAIAGPIAASGLPAIYTMHEYFLLCPNGGFYNYQTGDICRLKPLSVACWASHCDSRGYGQKLWRNLRGVVMDHVAHLPEVFSDIICITQFQIDEIGPQLPAARIHLLSNPIDARDQGPKMDPTRGEIVFVGRISPEKGCLLYAEAARRLGRVPVFVGDGPSRSELERRYPGARVLGWQSPESVAAHLRNARALVFPSLWYEAQGLTVLEALSQGTPVIVSDACAARDAVVDGVSGLWFRSDDADDLARAMAALDVPGAAMRLSHGAYRHYWADPPTLERHVVALERIYRGLANVPAGSAAPAEDDIRAA